MEMATPSAFMFLIIESTLSRSESENARLTPTVPVGDAGHRHAESRRRSSGDGSPDDRDTFDLDARAERQAIRTKGAACRLGAREEARVHLVHRRPLRHVGEERRALHDPLPGGEGTEQLG